MITADARKFWADIAMRRDWIQYILPKRTAAEFEQEGRLQAIDLCQLTPFDGTIIEYGCGIGRITKYAAIYAERMIGLDLCQAFIDKARAHDALSEYHLIDEFAETGIADVVYSVSVMQHNTMPNVKKAMAYIHQLLKPGGICLVTFAHGPVYHEGVFIHKFSESEVRELAADFDNVRIIKSNLVNYAGYTVPDGETNELILMARKG